MFEYRSESPKNALLQFYLFHILLLLSIISIFRTVYTDPGQIHPEYVLFILKQEDIYSIINFLKVFFGYICEEDIEFERSDLKDDIQFIISLNDNIQAVFENYRESNL